MQRRPHHTALLAASAALLWSILACAAPTQHTQPQPQDEQTSAQETSKTPLTQPSPQTVARAQEYGLPAVPKGSDMAGPFDGPENSLLYYNAQGLVSFYRPELNAAYFASAQPQWSWRYGVSAAGVFAFDAQGQATQLNGFPQEMASWPQAEAIVTTLIARVQAQAQQPQAQPTPQASAQDYEVMSQISRQLHDTNMSILGGMGSQGCTEHYEGVYYLGCW